VHLPLLSLNLITTPHQGAAVMDYAPPQAAQQPPMTPMAAPVQLGTQRFKFNGSGSEYFRIWIVNLLLTIVTVGIYSAWAKVRKQKYFYNSTTVAGASFEYHGKPIAILKGRLISLGMLAVYYGMAYISPVAALAALAVLMGVMPWLLWKSFQFKLYNSSYRGVRFGFDGTVGGAHFVFLVLPAGLFILLSLAMILGGALLPKKSVIGAAILFFIVFASTVCIYPYIHYRFKQYQLNSSRFGTTEFVFEGQFGQFLKAYLLTGLIFLASVTVVSALFGATLFSAAMSGTLGSTYRTAIIVLVLAFYGLIFAVTPILTAMIQNAVWNHTRLGPHDFKSDLPIGKTVFVTFTNVLLVVCTLGLAIPFAAVRLAKLKTEALALEPADDLNTFMAGAQNDASATGEGMADLMDFDIAL
jgi:uncharacterized membrane protein YjgN (DUF898 family)